MDILYVTLINVITLAVGFAIGFYFNNKKSNWWRILMGSILAFIVSWVVGSLTWLGFTLILDVGANIPATLSNAVVKTFWFALFASVYGTYQGKKNSQKNPAFEI